MKIEVSARNSTGVTILNEPQFARAVVALLPHWMAETVEKLREIRNFSRAIRLPADFAYNRRAFPPALPCPDDSPRLA
jgi:hypothetical protein